MIPTKICGITNLIDAQLAVEFGARAVGFIFYEKSPRAISIQEASSISSQLPGSVSKVGVFVNHSKEFIDRVILKVHLNAIQLHGEESPEFCNRFDLPVIKALRINSKENLLAMDEYTVNGFLLDSYSTDQYGGTGKTFDWSLVKNNNNCVPFILSGGLNPGNIIRAIDEVSPDAVDINSGVELSPGIKDHEKIAQLFSKLMETETTGFQFV